jgi:sulfur-oxidizing protein SoxZ
MARSITMKAIQSAGGVEVRALINHPMSIGRLDQTSGNYVEAHYIEDVVISLNGKSIVQGDWSSGVARNPYLSFRVRGATPGDKLTLTWRDNRGASDTHEITLT